MLRLGFLLAAAMAATAAEHRGVVRLGPVAVPGAMVVASRQGHPDLTTITGADGSYTFADLAPGAWQIEVKMQLFAPLQREIQVAAEPSEPAQWQLDPLPVEQLSTVSSAAPAASRSAVYQPAAVAQGPTPAPSKPAPTQEPDPGALAELSRQAADGFLINGSLNNGAASPFAQFPAFGNFRRGQRSLYNGNFGIIANSSVLDARPFSLTGQQLAKPDYNRVQGLFSFGGPIRIPRLIRRNGPTFSINYQWTRNRTANTQTALVPTSAQRSGDFRDSVRPVTDPTSGVPYPDQIVPATRISAQARRLLDLYPLPNTSGTGRYNFQVPVVNGIHQDDLQTRINKRVRRHSLAGSFALQSTRTDNPNLFGFLDTGRMFGWNSGFNYSRAWNSRTLLNTGVQFSRLNTRRTPWFSYRENVSGQAGILGNNQEPINWGPPSLQFSSGIASMAEPQALSQRNQTTALSADGYLGRGKHNFTLGYTRRWQQFNLESQQDARGAFTFTGASAGNDLAAFLLGVPDTASIAYGNADKYLRSSIHEAFVNDDWRVNPGLTINAGIRWEYWSPVTEKYGRLVNLRVAPGFASATPVVARDGSGEAFPQPDRNNFAPRVSFAWRPLSGTATVVRGGYGIYYDTSVYPSIATLMSQQAPLSTSLRLANSAATPLTLAHAFLTRNANVAESTTFGVDPNLRVGYLQAWQLSVQRDLPWALQMTAVYSGNKGSRGQQQILPGTYPDGTIGPAAGYTWLISNGDSTRQAGQIQLRRRLRSGLASSLEYTWSKSLDNAAPGGRNQAAPLLAQNWLDLAAERGLSGFDQRHVFSANLQYTTGMGLAGGALRTGRLAAWLKEWTFGTQFDMASGTPQTPVYFRAVAGTGVTGSLRPDYTGSSLYDAPAGYFLNPAAVAAPRSGQWGNAGRNSIRGPAQFVMNAFLSRAVRINERIRTDFRIEAVNALNSVNYSRWNTVAGNSQFGLPAGANAMRTVQADARVRF